MIFMTLMMYYIGLNIYIYFFLCVVKTHLCSTEAIDNVELYNVLYHQVARQTVQVMIIYYLTNLKHQNMI